MWQMKASSATSAGSDHNKSGESQKRSSKAQTKRMVALAFDKLAQLVLQNRVAVDARQREPGLEERSPPWVRLRQRAVFERCVFLFVLFSCVCGGRCWSMNLGVVRVDAVCACVATVAGPRRVEKRTRKSWRTRACPVWLDD